MRLRRRLAILLLLKNHLHDDPSHLAVADGHGSAVQLGDAPGNGKAVLSDEKKPRLSGLVFGLRTTPFRQDLRRPL